MKKALLIIAIVVIVFAGCTPKETDKSRITEFVVNDMKKHVLKAPSSLIIDSITINNTDVDVSRYRSKGDMSNIWENQTYIRLNNKYMRKTLLNVMVYYQAQNSFGAMLKGQHNYLIDVNY